MLAGLANISEVSLLSALLVYGHPIAYPSNSYRSLTNSMARKSDMFWTYKNGGYQRVSAASEEEAEAEAAAARRASQDAWAKDHEDLLRIDLGSAEEAAAADRAELMRISLEDGSMIRTTAELMLARAQRRAAEAAWDRDHDGGVPRSPRTSLHTSPPSSPKLHVSLRDDSDDAMMRELHDRNVKKRVLDEGDKASSLLPPNLHVSAPDDSDIEMMRELEELNERRRVFETAALLFPSDSEGDGKATDDAVDMADAGDKKDSNAGVDDRDGKAKDDAVDMADAGDKNNSNAGVDDRRSGDRKSVDRKSVSVCSSTKSTQYSPTTPHYSPTPSVTGESRAKYPRLGKR